VSQSNSIDWISLFYCRQSYCIFLLSRYKIIKTVEIVDNMQDTLVPQAISTSQSITLTEHVFKQIQSAIVLGQIPAGSKISEPELARIYGISRGPLREAIHRLEGQRLVERTAHVGARVVSLSLQQFKELYQIRASLEGLAVNWLHSILIKNKF
jgi:DNA-binding transcriptional regulator YhcF (GntR family)